MEQFKFSRLNKLKWASDIMHRTEQKYLEIKKCSDEIIAHQNRVSELFKAMTRLDEVCGREHACEGWWTRWEGGGCEGE